MKEEEEDGEEGGGGRVGNGDAVEGGERRRRRKKRRRKIDTATACKRHRNEWDETGKTAGNGRTLETGSEGWEEKTERKYQITINT